jgi:hypothetical protein
MDAAEPNEVPSDNMSDQVSAVHDEAAAVVAEALALQQEAEKVPTAGEPLATQLQSLAQHLDAGGLRCRMLLDQSEATAQHRTLIEEAHARVQQLAEAIRKAAVKPAAPAAEPAGQK